MVNVGKVSYGMYLFHWAILEYVCNRIFTTDNLALKVIVFIPYVITVYLFASLSFRVYESQFLKLKDTLFTKKKSEKANIQVVQPPASELPFLKPASHE